MNQQPPKSASISISNNYNQQPSQSATNLSIIKDIFRILPSKTTFSKFLPKKDIFKISLSKMHYQIRHFQKFSLKKYIIKIAPSKSIFKIFFSLKEYIKFAPSKKDVFKIAPSKKHFPDRFNLFFIRNIKRSF